jgi:alginate O-acetyltransferase complex protein AlgI
MLTPIIEASFMLFNSYIFIFIFLPVTVLGFYYIGKRSHPLALLWLAVASLFFYSWWDVRFVGLLSGSIVFNYSVGYLIRDRHSLYAGQAKWILTGGIMANLMLLGYFKYANFFIENINSLIHTSFSTSDILLPLGISFFTFTQIAFLADAYQGKAKEYNFIRYTLFVTYFPHLIAGPVLHHKEMMPQFARHDICRINWENIATGLTIFLLGLAKKIFIADSLADFATPVFTVVQQGGQPLFFEAWIGALSYSLQLYFDFSAYSDMAIGLSLLFNVRLPINFDSPYKAASIIEFWRCWHITLSRFLRDYLYIPLGGNRHGPAQRYLNLMITMLLGGLWHGAGWTFVIWGGLHGLYLLINHAWRELKAFAGWHDGGKNARLLSGIATFLAVVVGWVFFRADSVDTAMRMLNGMMGLNGCSVSNKLGRFEFSQALENFGFQFNGVMTLTKLKTEKIIQILIVTMIIVFKLPNITQIMANYQVALTAPNLEIRKPDFIHWQPSLWHALSILILGFFTLINLSKQSPFLYFQF